MRKIKFVYCHGACICEHEEYREYPEGTPDSEIEEEYEDFVNSFTNQGSWEEEDDE